MARLKTLALVPILAIGTSCKPRQESTAETKGALDSVTKSYEWFTKGLDVQSKMPADKRVEKSMSNCGLEKSKVATLKNGAGLTPDVYNEETVWREFLRPEVPGVPCHANETLDTKQKGCWAKYGLQFFPAPVQGKNSRYLASGIISPLWRIIPKEEYPAAGSACQFNKDTALIWVAGVGNRDQGTTWENTTPQLLAGIMAWNRNSRYPAEVPGAEVAGHGKLSSWPGYIQVVENNNAPSDGINGVHSEKAILALQFDLEMAYRSGVKQVEVVTHSNGMVTAQVAFALLARRFNDQLWKKDYWPDSIWKDGFEKTLDAGRAWMVSERAKNGGGSAMKINFYHLQAAPHDSWWRYSKDVFGFSSDFIPHYKWIRSEADSVLDWTWDADSYMNKIAPYFDISARFYYNAPDWMTFGTYGITSVGIRRSSAWQRDAKRAGAKIPIAHYVCSGKDKGSCGPAHSQTQSLWDFGSPSMPSTARAIHWEVAPP